MPCCPAGSGRLWMAASAGGASASGGSAGTGTCGINATPALVWEPPGSSERSKCTCGCPAGWPLDCGGRTSADCCWSGCSSGTDCSCRGTGASSAGCAWKCGGRSAEGKRSLGCSAPCSEAATPACWLGEAPSGATAPNEVTPVPATASPSCTSAAAAFACAACCRHGNRIRCKLPAQYNYVSASRVNRAHLTFESWLRSRTWGARRFKAGPSSASASEACRFA